ncbi:unnamed protein product [Owenia fusiformis]|uniref:Uncharacterized protein n=1 Tax=Owenia fusiformis TaxID=6347 RepID=A0A8J1U7D8_OWEFU|nr:unnamed protein product [Owenia fusiformis]
MFSKQKGWFIGGMGKPKNTHSLENLKYLHAILCKNQTVTEHNRSLLVETLRSISEILIWGDQNDSTVFDFFLEKNMLAFFIRYMRQKSGRYICVQLLQTLNILFENISNETSVYYLLSNNHVNSIIIHRFDFSDEEVMAYYISFLKTLSLKLNKHTIHFFYNEHTNDFALYTEAIKFFNHSETMVRIAVRTITLNVYKVEDQAMLRYIRDKTAAPYFSNLVWFIGNHILQLDSCVRNDADHQSRDRLADIVAEHLDHLHYLNDILCLKIDALNDVLSDHLLNRLLIPLYVYSLTKRKKYSSRVDQRPHISSVVSLFLLSQVFLIISHAPLVRQLADIILNGDITYTMASAQSSPAIKGRGWTRGFIEPEEPLAQTLENNRGGGRPLRRPNYRDEEEEGVQRRGEGASRREGTQSGNSTFYTDEEEPVHEAVESTQETVEAESSEAPTPPSVNDSSVEPSIQDANITDEEKLRSRSLVARDDDVPVAVETSSATIETQESSVVEEDISVSTEEERPESAFDLKQKDFTLVNRPYLEAVFTALECTENDYEALFALCLLYALGHNEGINQELLDTVLMTSDKSPHKSMYNKLLMEQLIKIVSLSCHNGSKVRLATLEMSLLLVKQLVLAQDRCYLQDRHLACIEGAREEAMLLLRNFYKSEEIFLDMFEDEYREFQKKPLNVEYLTMDASILLPPTGTPLTGIEFSKRLPCGEVERARRSIRVYFLLRDLSLKLQNQDESQLPLTRNDECVKVGDVLDLNNSDLIACTVINKDNKKERRFLVIDVLQLILVEPDTRRLGWGVVRFVGFLQDVEVAGDKEDSRSLHVTIHKPAKSMHAKPFPLLAAKFMFDDHIRCMAAKQRLSKGRIRARQRKMQMIARLLEIPNQGSDGQFHMANVPSYARSASGIPIPGRVRQMIPRNSSDSQIPRRQQGNVERSVFQSVDNVPAFNSARQREARHSERYTSRGVHRAQSQPQAMTSQPVGVSSVSLDLSANRSDSDIEQALDATSPSAFAVQTLNNVEPENEANGRHSRNSSDGVSHIEIPLEDMSRDRTPVEESPIPSGPVRRTSSPSLRGRPGTRSPRRTRSSSSPVPPPPSSISPRRSPLTVDSKKISPRSSVVQSLSISPKRNRARSLPTPPDQAESCLNSPPSESPPSGLPQGNLSKLQVTRVRSTSGGSPKTLLPAPTAPVSLIPDCDVTIPSAKILPPTETPSHVTPEYAIQSQTDKTEDKTNKTAKDAGNTTPGTKQEQTNESNNKSNIPNTTTSIPQDLGIGKQSINVQASQVSATPDVQDSPKHEQKATDQLAKVAQAGENQADFNAQPDGIAMGTLENKQSETEIDVEIGKDENAIENIVTPEGIV